MARASRILLALIFITLLLKVLAARANPLPSAETAVVELDTMLGDAGFASELVRLQRSPGIVVSASGRDCRMVAGDYLPHGTFADAYAELARPFGPLRYAYRGRLHERAPRIRALFDFYLWRELRRMGVPYGRPAIFAIAATSGCDLARLPWHKVAKVSG